MNKCPKCQSDVGKNDAFCKNCGTSLEVLECPKCHSQNLKVNTFCTKCGTNIHTGQEVKETPINIEEDLIILDNEDSVSEEVALKPKKGNGARGVFFWISLGLILTLFVVFFSSFMFGWVSNSLTGDYLNSVAYMDQNYGSLSLIQLFVSLSSFSLSNGDPLVLANLIINATVACLAVVFVITVFVLFIVSTIKKTLSIEKMLKWVVISNIVFMSIRSFTSLNGTLVLTMIVLLSIVMTFLTIVNAILNYHKMKATNFVFHLLPLIVCFIVFCTLPQFGFSTMRNDGSGYNSYINYHGIGMFLLTSRDLLTSQIVLGFLSSSVAFVTMALLFTISYRIFTNPYRVKVLDFTLSFAVLGLALVSFVCNQVVDTITEGLTSSALGLRLNIGFLALSPFFMIPIPVFQVANYYTLKK